MPSNISKYVILIGLVIVIVGLILHFAGDKLTWIGRLPGDISVEKENVRFYLPIITMILASLLLTLIINLVKRIL